MEIFKDRKFKRFFILLAALLLLSAGLIQIHSYINAQRFKDEMLLHDYEAAGFLIRQHPEMATDIKLAFTGEKSAEDLETGRALMKSAGYQSDIALNLKPELLRVYQTDSAVLFVLTIMPAILFLLLTAWFIRQYFQRLDQYSSDIVKIMNGEEVLLHDREEGSLSRLAAAVNRVTSSLHAHAEKEKESRSLLKDNLMNISHQLKTPISALMMYIEIMQEENTDNKVIRDFLKKSENELTRMLTLTTNLLKLARLDAGDIEIKREVQSLNGIIYRVLETFEDRIAREGKTCEFTPDTDIACFCDREWMVEAISNLIKNALEHTDKGGRIRVSVEQTQLFIRIEVEDNGRGIHHEDLPFVFRRFYRSKFSQNQQGTGIGLTLTKAIIEMHEGLIDVESVPGKGTCFSIRLPVVLQNRKTEFISR